MKRMFISFVFLFSSFAICPFKSNAQTRIVGPNFQQQLAERYPELSKSQREKYKAELLANHYFEKITMIGERAEKAKNILMPVLKLFNRENYTEVAVFEDSKPFVATYREFTIIFSDSSLKIFSDEQLRAIAAHELAHDVFMKEFERASAANDFSTMQQVELKCDLLAAQVSTAQGENPMAIIEAVKLLRKSLSANGVEIKTAGTHPEPTEREKFLKNNFKIFSKN